MLTKRFTASIQLPARGKAPERFRVWRAGANVGDYGACNFTPAAAAAVMADFTARGNAGAIDVEHGTNPKANPNYDPSTPPPGGGYYVLDLVDTDDGPELWASVRWSDFALAQIESGQRCYVSPDWLMSTDTREPSKLNKLSLVQEPGTFSVAMLASRASATTTENHMDLDTLKALIAAAQKMADSAENADLKAIGTDLVKQLTDMASKLGLDLTEAAAPATEPAVVAPVAAAEPEAKPMPAVAGKSITIADVQAAIREERAKSDLLTAAVAGRQGMTPALVSILAGKTLAECRAFVGALPMAAVSTVKVTLPALNATAGAAAAGEPETSPSEASDIEKIRKQMGVSILAVTAAKSDAGKGTLGVLSIARIQEMKAAGKAAGAAKVAAAK